MRCIKCGLRFVNKEITAEDEQGRDLCPACGSPIDSNEIELAITITEAINRSFDNKVFVERMSIEHRTLQSEFTSLCLDWLLKCREMYEEDNYDGRNKLACRSGKVLMDYLEKGEF